MGKKTSRITTLDPLAVGTLLIKFPLVADLLGHQRVAATIHEYFHPQTRNEEFVQDFFKLYASSDKHVLQNFLNKWYGDKKMVETFKQTLISQDSISKK